jgi:hypothetical protein
MAAFDASQIEDLDYDLTKWVEGMEGTVSEPTEKDIDAFLKGVATAAAKEAKMPVEKIDPSNPESLSQMLNNLNTQENRKLSEDLLAKLCKGEPTKAQLQKLPFRPFNLFFNWLVAEIMDPNAGSGVTTTSQEAQTDAALTTHSNGTSVSHLPR